MKDPGGPKICLMKQWGMLETDWDFVEYLHRIDSVNEVHLECHGPFSLLNYQPHCCDCKSWRVLKISPFPGLPLRMYAFLLWTFGQLEFQLVMCNIQPSSSKQVLDFQAQVVIWKYLSAWALIDDHVSTPASHVNLYCVSIFKSRIQNLIMLEHTYILVTQQNVRYSQIPNVFPLPFTCYYTMLWSPSRKEPFLFLVQIFTINSFTVAAIDEMQNIWGDNETRGLRLTALSSPDPANPGDVVSL